MFWVWTALRPKTRVESSALGWFLAWLLVAPAALYAQSRPLDIYWIDVEGGAATLLVSPSGESMLVDTGYEVGGRDAARIHAAAKQAGLSRIDHVVISHYHGDHVGGLAALSKLIPLGRFYGRGDETEAANQKWLDSYRTVSAGRRTIVKPGDRILLAGAQVVVVASDSQFLSRPVNGGGPNSLCAGAEQRDPAGPENKAGVGVLVTFNRFTFLDLIDADWHTELEMVCPVNTLGRVTVYEAGRHGSFDGAGAPAFLGAIQPQVVVINNGPKKGLGQTDDRIKPIIPPGAKPQPYERNGYARLAALPSVEGVWQQHLSLLDRDPKHNTAEDMIANLAETAEHSANWIKASVQPDGRFTVTNSRNGVSRTYTAR